MSRINVSGTIIILVAETAQSVQQFTTEWTVRGSNPGGGEVYPHPYRQALGAHPASYTMGTGSFPGVKLPGLTTHPLEPRLKEE